MGSGNGMDWRQRASTLASVLAAEGIRDTRVLEAIANVPRHLFLPAGLRDRAYEDRALAIGHGQTISQPFIVAHMTELLAVQPGTRVLEVGTGSGYQAAVLSEIGCEVYSVEIVPELAEGAREALAKAGYPDVKIRIGDGAEGWAEHAPYDAVIVTAVAPEVPQALLDQLAAPGRMAIPLESRLWAQYVWSIRKDADGQVHRERTVAVRFVPLTGGQQG